MKCGTLSLLLGAALLAGAPSVFCGDAAGKNAGDRIFLADLSGKTPLAAQWQVKANLKVENGELTLKGTVADPKVTLPEEYRIRFSGKIKEEDEQVKGGFLTVSLDQKVTVLVRLGARGPSQILHPDPQNPKRNTGATRKTRIQLNETFQCEVCRRKAGDGRYEYSFTLNGTPVGSVVETPGSPRLSFGSWRVSPVLTGVEIFRLQ